MANLKTVICFGSDAPCSVFFFADTNDYEVSIPKNKWAKIVWFQFEASDTVYIERIKIDNILKVEAKDMFSVISSQSHADLQICCDEGAFQIIPKVSGNIAFVVLSFFQAIPDGIQLFFRLFFLTALFILFLLFYRQLISAH